MQKKYKLSPQAKKDLVQILDYTYENFGHRQAEKYYLGLHKTFELIVENPKIGRSAPHIRQGLRYLIAQRHAVYYTAENETIIVLRVLRSELEFEE